MSINLLIHLIRAYLSCSASPPRAAAFGFALPQNIRMKYKMRELPRRFEAKMVWHFTVGFEGCARRGKAFSIARFEKCNLQIRDDFRAGPGLELTG